MQIEFVIHGVPQGHQVWGTQADKYYESFYGKYEIYGKPKQVFVVEVRDNPETRRAQGRTDNVYQREREYHRYAHPHGSYHVLHRAYAR